MATFHLTPEGPKPCRATKRACPIGGEHFENEVSAYAAFEKELAAQAVPSGVRKWREPLLPPLTWDHRQVFVAEALNSSLEEVAEDCKRWFRRDNSEAVKALSEAMEKYGQLPSCHDRPGPLPPLVADLQARGLVDQDYVLGDFQLVARSGNGWRTLSQANGLMLAYLRRLRMEDRGTALYFFGGESLGTPAFDGQVLAQELVEESKTMSRQESLQLSIESHEEQEKYQRSLYHNMLGANPKLQEAYLEEHANWQELTQEEREEEAFAHYSRTHYGFCDQLAKDFTYEAGVKAAVRSLADPDIAANVATVQENVVAQMLRRIAPEGDDARYFREYLEYAEAKGFASFVYSTPLKTAGENYEKHMAWLQARYEEWLQLPEDYPVGDEG